MIRAKASLLLFFGLASGLAACGDDGEPGTEPAPDAGTPLERCPDGLVKRPFRAGGTGTRWGDLVGDFTLQTTAGPWTLSERWTGCESYVFLLDLAEGDLGDEAWYRTVPEAFFTRSPASVHYFFVSERTGAEAQARLDRMRDRLDAVLESVLTLTPEEIAAWRARLHFVTQSPADIVGPLGDAMRGRPAITEAMVILPQDAQRDLASFLVRAERTRFHQAAIGIDRLQRLDPVGHLSPFAIGSELDLNAAAYAPLWYDYRAALEDRLEAEAADATVVPVASEDDSPLRVFTRTVTLPDAATMATFDTFEVDVTVLCKAEFVNCSEWDRNAYVNLCDDAACTTSRELVRWITPYWRPGEQRWLMDASPLLGLVAAGGARTIQLVFGPDWERATPWDLDVSFRFSRRGATTRAFAAERAFTGGNFDAGYNDRQTPFTFTPPAGTTRVELVVIVSGHGQTAGNNCAEWCDHEHTFRVNEAPPRRIEHEGSVGSATGCGEFVDAGVFPGQFGNWAPERAYWCPGWPVEAKRFDITGEVDLAGANTLTYAGSFAGGTPAGGNIDLSAYVAYYRPPSTP